jgi:hypothetical protein
VAVRRMTSSGIRLPKSLVSSDSSCSRNGERPGERVPGTAVGSQYYMDSAFGAHGRSLHPAQGRFVGLEPTRTSGRK